MSNDLVLRDLDHVFRLHGARVSDADAANAVEVEYVVRRLVCELGASYVASLVADAKREQSRVQRIADGLAKRF